MVVSIAQRRVLQALCRPESEIHVWRPDAEIRREILVHTQTGEPGAWKPDTWDLPLDSFRVLVRNGWIEKVGNDDPRFDRYVITPRGRWIGEDRKVE